VANSRGGSGDAVPGVVFAEIPVRPECLVHLRCGSGMSQHEEFPVGGAEEDRANGFAAIGPE
jgi:hypothetical protein